jgi:hypothetical protein
VKYAVERLPFSHVHMILLLRPSRHGGIPDDAHS